MNSNRRLRYILIIVWALILVSNIYLTVKNPTIIGGICVGFGIGGLFIIIIDTPLLFLLDDQRAGWVKRTFNYLGKYNNGKKKNVKKNGKTS